MTDMRNAIIAYPFLIGFFAVWCVLLHWALCFVNDHPYKFRSALVAMVGVAVPFLIMGFTAIFIF